MNKSQRKYTMSTMGASSDLNFFVVSKFGAENTLCRLIASHAPILLIMIIDNILHATNEY